MVRKPGFFRHLRKPGFLVLPAFLISVLALSACVDRLPDQDLRILTATPTAKLSADLLWKEFQEQADRARQSYWGKVIEVTGTATKVGTDTPHDRYILFGQAGDAGVRANLLDESAAAILANIPDNRRLTLRCYCDGLSGDVILKSCVKP